MLDDYIKDKGIIKCVNNSKETYYLDIEAHILYSPDELSKVLKERGEDIE